MMDGCYHARFRLSPSPAWGQPPETPGLCDDEKRWMLLYLASTQVSIVWLQQQQQRAMRGAKLSLATLGDKHHTFALLNYVDATERFPRFYSPVLEDQRKAMKSGARAAKTKDKENTCP